MQGQERGNFGGRAEKTQICHRARGGASKGSGETPDLFRPVLLGPGPRQAGVPRFASGGRRCFARLSPVRGNTLGVPHKRHKESENSIARSFFNRCEGCPQHPQHTSLIKHCENAFACIPSISSIRLFPRGADRDGP